MSAVSQRSAAYTFACRGDYAHCSLLHISLTAQGACNSFLREALGR